jgi:ligand-binding sensor domain-containing protein
VLALDKRGKLLIGTAQGGILSFDGTFWKQLPGPGDNNVRGMTVDNQGSVWAWMQSAGVVRYDGTAWQPVVNRFSGVLTTDPAGDIWLLNSPLSSSPQCDGWLHEYSREGLQSTVSLAPVCSLLTYPTYLAVDNKKNCWIGTQNTIIKLNQYSAERFPVSNDTASPKSLTALAINYAGKVLLARTDYSGKSEIFIYDQVNGKGQLFDSSAFTFNNGYITTAYADPTGEFWCSGSDGTIIHIDQFRKVTFLNTGNSVLPSNSIASLLIDKSDNLWAATASGIAKFDGAQWTIYPATGDTLPGRNISAIAMDSSGVIWAGLQQPIYSSMASTGLAYFSEHHWHQLTRDHISVKIIAVDKLGDQWVVTGGGVYRYHEMNGTQIFETVESSDAEISLGTSVNTIAFDKENTPWIGTGLGIKKYVNGIWIDDTTIARNLTKAGGTDLATGFGVNAINFSGTVAWIGTTNGLFKCTSGNCERFDTTGGILPDKAIQCIAVNGPNSAWIGTKHGLVHLDGPNHTVYTNNNTALSDNDITSIAIKQSGDVWVGTRLGGLTLLQQSSTMVIPGVDPVAKQIDNPVDISYSNLSQHAFRISIKTKHTCAIGFSLISLQGKLIKHFDAVSPGVQNATFTWDGTNRSNRRVPAGMYLGVVTGDGKIIGSKMLPR